MIKSNPFVLFTSISLLLIGCSNEESAKEGLNTGTDSAATGMVQQTDMTGSTGRVLSSVEVPGYTYIEVDINGRTTWIAGTPVEVVEGDTISWVPSTVMTNFYSKTLDRTFDEVIFVAGIGPSTAGVASTDPHAMPHGMPSTMPHAMPSSMPSAASMVAATPGQDLAQGVVVSTQNAANYTYLEVQMADEKLIWLAAPETPISVDDTIEWQSGSLMTNFTSSSLGKTFPEIYFVTAVQVRN